ncbi:DNA helicase II [Microbulbifer aestuariivivens]|uniref:DNA 3'-5' helicase n=1 Tax=Microbulbifer aestuariivivens TaxID=1908308 RepID=A0ABP9WSK3_9GAMM
MAEPNPVLTDEQQAVAEHPGGHAKIIAVAGSGKTTALLHYVKNRLASGVAPQRILVLMYNRSAREDFAQRLDALIQGAGQAPKVQTFHSLGYRLYQRMIASGHIAPANLSPLPQSVAQLQIWRAIEECAAAEELEDIRARKQSEIEAAEFFIDYAKTILDGELSAFQELKLGDEYQYFLKVFHCFEEWRRSQQAVTYADLIYDPAIFLSLHPEIAAQYGGHFEDILVDEYQDINAVQHFLLKAVHGKNGNVIAIGDPDQTIYEWRGSKPAYLLRYFDDDFPPSNIYKLSRTFRYGHTLSLAANHCIQHNRERADILCISAENTLETRVDLHACDNEAHWLVEHLRRRMKQGESLQQVAILVRLWSAAAPLELALLAANIPYRSANRNTVLSRRELRPLFWSLNIASGRFRELPQDRRRRGLYEWLTAPHIRIPRRVLEPLCADVARRDGNWGQRLYELVPQDISQAQARRLKQRAALLQEFERWRGTGGELLRRQLGELDYLSGIADDSFTRQQGEERQQAVLAFCQYLDRLRQPPAEVLAHLQELQRQHQEGEQGDADAVLITTMHQAKGLEWDQVIIPALNRHNMPYQPQRDFSTPASLESERRLLYVAMTRARRHLLLLTPAAPTKPADDSESQCPSPFIEEMQLPLCHRLASALLERPATLPGEAPVTRLGLRYLKALGFCPELEAPAREEAPAALVRRPQAGENIRHRKLGYGRVLQWDGERLEVQFSDKVSRRFDWERLQPFLT